MLRFDLSPKFRAWRETDRDPDPAAEMVRATRDRARRTERARMIAGAVAFAAAAPFVAFKAQQLGQAPATQPGLELVAKAPASPPVAPAQKPLEERLARGVDFTATSATCSASAKEGEDAFCGPTRSGARSEARDANKAKAAKAPKTGKSAKTGKPAKSADTGAAKIKKATPGKSG